MRIVRHVALLGLVAAMLAAMDRPGPEKEWAKGIPYFTDWDKAIKAVRESGKMLFIYNGWEKEKI